MSTTKKRETKFVLTQEQVVSALKGELQGNVPGIDIISGEAARSIKEGFPFFADFEWFILFRDSNIPSLNMAGLEVKEKTVVVFTGSVIESLNMENVVIPHLRLENCEVGEMRFVESSILSGFYVVEESDAADIRILNSTFGDIGLDHCNTGDIFIGQQSTTGVIKINHETSCGNLEISEASTVGSVSVFGSSTIEDLTVSSKSNTSDIKFLGESSAEDITVRSNSNCGNISISDKCKVGYITISKSEVINVSITDRASAADLEIKDRSVTGEIRINQNAQVGDLTITESHTLKIKIYNAQLCWVDITNSSTGHFDVSDVQMDEIHIMDSTCGKIKLGSVDMKGLYLHNSVCGAVQLDSCILRFGLALEEVISGELSITDSKFSLVELRKFCNNVSLLKADVGAFVVTLSHIPLFTLQAAIRGEFSFKRCRINCVDISDTILGRDCSLTLSTSRIRHITFRECGITGQLYLRNIIALETPDIWWKAVKISTTLMEPSIRVSEVKKKRLQYLRLVEYQVLKKVREREVRFGRSPLFEIVNSSLGKSEIIGCDFRKFQFVFYNTKIQEIFTTGSIFPNDPDQVHIKRKGHLRQQGKKSEADQRLSFFSQMRRVHENQGDSMKASEYQKLAMDQQQLLLRLEGASWWKLMSKEGEEAFIFLWNKLSNNHGVSWLRAAVFISFGALIFFTLYNIHLSLRLEPPQGSERNYLSDLWNNMPKIFDFAIPTHKWDFIRQDVGGWGYFWDFIGRIVIGYGIYQFIVAFRRHGKK